MSEFYYGIQYKPGIINEADAFSRALVASTHANLQSDDNTDRQLIELEGPLIIDEIWDAQLSDETLTQLRDKNDDTSLTKSPTLRTLLRRIGEIFERDDILYIHDDNTDKIILPLSMHDTILKELHAQPFEGHLGVSRTFSAIRSRYFWPALASIVANYVKQCCDCAMFKRATVNTTPPLVAIPCSRPNELVEMDIVGPTTVSSKGNKYILTIVNAWTKWPEAYPIPNQETEFILPCVEDYISRHGVPDTILTDQGRNFEAQLFPGFCQSFNITKKRT